MSHPGHRPRLTRMDIQESTRLRFVAQRQGWDYGELAAVCRCHADTIRAWMSGKYTLSVDRQWMLKSHWPKETAWPGR